LFPVNILIKKGAIINLDEMKAKKKPNNQNRWHGLICDTKEIISYKYHGKIQRKIVEFCTKNDVSLKYI